MFNATNGRQAVTTRIDELSDNFAANFEDRLKELSLAEQLSLIEQLNSVVTGTDTAKSFAAGTYAQSKDGSPARALGAGSTPGPVSDSEALNTLLGSSSLSDGIKQALRRILVPGDPDHIRVETDGTPSDVKTLRTQVGTLTTERDTAITERDAAKNAKAPTPADAVDKAKVKKAIADVKAGADKVTATKSFGSGITVHKTELNKAIEEAEKLVA